MKRDKAYLTLLEEDLQDRRKRLAVFERERETCSRLDEQQHVALLTGLIGLEREAVASVEAELQTLRGA